MDGAKRFVSAAKSIRKSVILKRKSICMDLNASQDDYAEFLKEVAAHDNAQDNEPNAQSAGDESPAKSETTTTTTSSKSSRKSSESKKSSKKEPLLSLE